MSTDEIEKRVSKLEHSLTFFKGASLVFGVAILAMVGVTTYSTIPTAAREAAKREVSDQTKKRLSEALEISESLLSGNAIVYPPVTAESTDENVKVEKRELGKHTLCALTGFTFNKAQTTNTKICNLKQDNDGIWMISATAEPKQVMSCQASCIPN